MTNKEAIDAINKECEKTMLLLTCSSEFANALAQSIKALEEIDNVRAEVRAEIHSKLMQEMAELNETKMNENNLMTFAYRIKQIAEQLEEQNSV